MEMVKEHLLPFCNNPDPFFVVRDLQFNSCAHVSMGWEHSTSISVKKKKKKVYHVLTMGFYSALTKREHLQHGEL